MLIEAARRLSVTDRCSADCRLMNRTDSMGRAVPAAQEVPKGLKVRTDPMAPLVRMVLKDRKAQEPESRPDCCWAAVTTAVQSLLHWLAGPQQRFDSGPTTQSTQAAVPRPPLPGLSLSAPKQNRSVPSNTRSCYPNPFAKCNTTRNLK